MNQQIVSAYPVTVVTVMLRPLTVRHHKCLIINIRYTL